MAEEVNPFAASAAPEVEPQSFESHSGRSGKLVQLQAIGILQIVLGGLELLYVGLMGVGRVFLGLSLASSTGLNSPSFAVLFSVLFMLLAGVSGALRVLSGVQSRSFRGRPLMFVSLTFGLLTIFTCYCAPLSILVFVYGLVVMLDGQVARAYQMAARGIPADEIRRLLGG